MFLPHCLCAGLLSWLAAQLGLFTIRHKINDSASLAFRKEGYNFLRTSEEYKLFLDLDWYESLHKDEIAKSGMEPFRHFIHYGRLLAHDPRPEFNNAWYAITNTDLFNDGYDPLCHYLTCPAFEYRNPSPVFNTSVYVNTHPDVNWEKEIPLIHYLNHN